MPGATRSPFFFFVFLHFFSCFACVPPPPPPPPPPPLPPPAPPPLSQPHLRSFFLHETTAQKIYRASYVELQRNDAVSRSPVFAHFAESLSGVDTIRAYGRAPSFREKFERLVDRNHAAFFSLRSADQWLSLRLELCGSGIVLLAAVLSIAVRRRIPASLAALSLTEALDVTGILKYLVMSTAMLEARMNAVERLRAHSLLPSEAARETAEGRKPSGDWPTRGDLAFRDVWLRYRPGLEPALRGVSFELKAGAKAGVVGRTGSGKR